MMKAWIAAFALVCLAAPAAAQTFSNSGTISIPDRVGNANGYADSVINVSGLNGRLSGLSLTLTGISHSFSNDLVFGLVAENAGIGFIFWSEAGFNNALSNVTVSFSDSAAGFLPYSLATTAPITAGTYLPSNWAGYGVAGVNNAVFFSDFYGINPNGDWRLIALDTGEGDVGSVGGGWSLTMSTTPVGGAVPEPASWAMLIGGFALAGSALRRQRTSRAALAA
ncbi:PEPxxWA-CTERM sorting domain-containing protein [Sphingomonas sp. TDK1]|uniref:PEPxxWA-CTERM sorting domain-containing protein n=1 Tax=Sphingomonas sp. TDK1 TaxID=453247 RepID=UPI0007DA2F4A|nr:PEPxxWA-CTERM sorting domain-containing protein [Sphingomonas sp. TDK1]OAN58108.1 hypothetical protein A7X12_06230 [Sphingomonas sp. TDK1]